MIKRIDNKGFSQMSIAEVVRDVIANWIKRENKSMEELADLTGIPLPMLYKLREGYPIRLEWAVRLSMISKDFSIFEHASFLLGAAFIKDVPAEKYQTAEIIPNASKCAVEATRMLDVIVQALQNGDVSEEEFKSFRESGKKLRGRLEQLSILMEDKYARDRE